MFIAIVGTRFSGKSSIENYLVSSHGFTLVRIIQSDSNVGGTEEKFEVIELASTSSEHSNATSRYRMNTSDVAKHLSFLSMSPLPSPATIRTQQQFTQQQSLCFSSHTELLDYVTKNWRNDFVTSDLRTRSLIETFVRRPFFLLVSVDAPLLERFHRSKSFVNISLADFIAEDDRVVFGSRYLSSSQAESLQKLNDLVNIQIVNSFSSLSGLHSYLDNLDLLHPEHLRPSWDAYFMTLASLASRRSNCMKRRVGALLVRENRVLATGYNGTARGLLNCNEGGCAHCNGTNDTNGKCQECLCLHAEENALLEAGRERIGQDCVLYCNTCPCLKCTVKIIQTGVKTVVYNLTYKVDDASAALFKEAGVQLRRYDPNTRFRLPPAEDEGLISLTSEPESDHDTIVL
ncbi:Deoxycytidylate deaminase [Psilocybe cubensis]|uniref:Deoxycytidylate deaminase n=2 Tax=Psilocybe cubensis TaxID=181762 RepID=A0A8H7Y9Q6_PSICU|nr:Deoxycytidylate deaminase [Psilocybe cubensis]KAH9486498.1 Deoxycytidylate deaminase [Psilocybe cubensis]